MLEIIVNSIKEIYGPLFPLFTIIFYSGLSLFLISLIYKTVVKDTMVLESIISKNLQKFKEVLKEEEDFINKKLSKQNKTIKIFGKSIRFTNSKNKEEEL